MDTESQQALDAFGKAVVSEVYDRTCKFLHDTMTRGMRGNKPDPLHIAYQELDPATAAFVRQFLVVAVDQTFAQFLAFIDNHQIQIRFPPESNDSKCITSISDGLAAEPYNEKGWIARFSKFKNGILNS
jgi:hypothetical protein